MSDRTRGWLFVLVQLVLLVVLAVDLPGPRWRPPTPASMAGMLLVLGGVLYVVVGSLGLGPRTLTATPVPRASATLQTDGLYRWSRHPLYSGVIVIGVGLLLRRMSLVAAVALIGLIVLLDRKANYEEGLLADRYPEYAAYADRTPRFLPRLRRR